MSTTTGWISRRGLLAAGLAGLLLVSACGGGAEESTPAPGTEEPAATAPDGAATATEDEAAAERAPFKVGLLNPTTGVFAQTGSDTNAGFEYYLASKNGVLAGHPIEVVKEDDQGDPTAALTKARKLVEQDQVDIIVGVVSSAVAYGVADYVREQGTPFIITVAGADGLTQQQATENIFRISYTGSQPMMPFGEYACTELGYETAAIVSLDFAFGWETAGGFARTYEEAGCDVVQEVYVPLGTEDYAPFVQQINPGVDTVMHVNSGPSALLFWQAYRNFGLQPPVIGHGAITDEFILESPGDETIGALTIFYWSRALDTPENQAMVAGFEEATGALAAQGVEAGHVAAQVIEAALEQIGDGEVTSEALLGAISAVEITAPRGPLRFDDYNQAVMNFYTRETQSVEGDDRLDKANVVIDTIPEVSQFWTYDPEEYLGLPSYESLKGTWAEN